MRMLLAVLAGCAAAGCSSTPSHRGARAAEDAYQRGEADAVKRLYWAKQALEAPDASRPAGRVEYYTWEESGTARDGRRLAPETVGVPVFVPAPAASGGQAP